MSMQEIAFGMDVQAFMEGSIGKYLRLRANAEIEAAKEALTTVNPADVEAVRTLQNDVAVAARFLSWLGEAVDQGLQMERAIEAGE